MQEHKIYIDGQWVKSESGRTFLSLDPATERPIGKFQQGNENDVKKAIDAAEDAYHKWSEIPAPKRGEVLLKVAELLKKEKQRLGKLVATEMGKVMPEALGDVQEAKDKFAMTIRMPLSVVGLITPWNFPIAIPSWKLTPALICGNGIVLKPSSDTPLCAIELVKILEKAGIPKGVVNLVTGPGDTAGKELIKNDKVRGISFTGNKDTGEWILKEAGLKKVGLELGGKNAIIIMPDADLNLALEGALWGGF